MEIKAETILQLVTDSDGWADTHDLYGRYRRRHPTSAPEGSSFIADFEKALVRLVREGRLRSKERRNATVYNLPED